MKTSPLFHGPVPESLAGERLDKVLARLVPSLTRGQARRYIDEGCVFVARRRTKMCGRLVEAGEAIEVYLPAVRREGLAEPKIVEATSDWVVVDKPVGMPVEPTRQGATGTLVGWLGTQLPGQILVAHRLDVATSGLIVLARHRDALVTLNRAFAERLIERVYLAVVSPAPSWETFTFDSPLDGKTAVTHAEVTKRGAGAVVLSLTLETGRTNQIRRHLADAGHPLIGDRAFGGAPAARLLLHARRLAWPALPDELQGGARAFEAQPGPDFLAAAAPLQLI